MSGKTTTKTQVRAASAKIAGKGPKAEDKPSRQRKPGELSRFQKAVIILFVVVFALSTLAGALASVFQAQSSQNVEVTVESLDETYQGYVDDLEEKVAANPEDKDSLLSLGRYYASWGSNVSMLASTDDETSHANDLLDHAIDCFDRYLELEDSNEVRVDRALCLYYQEDVSGAVSALEELTQGGGADYAPAWSTLGSLYATRGDYDDAKAAYQRAIELDPDDEQGVKSSAESALESIEKAEQASDPAVTSSTGDLAEDLSNATGTGL